MLQTLLQKSWLRLLLIGIVIAGVVGGLSIVPGSPTERLRIALTDYFYTWSLDTLQPSSDIVIVAIDDKTLADPRFGRWQDWRRTYYADLLRHLAPHQPAAIGIDVSFSEKSKNPADDAAFAAEMQRLGNVVLVVQAQNKLWPTKVLADSALTTAFADFNVDSDNVVRRSKVDLLMDGAPYESFAATLARLKLGEPPQENCCQINAKNEYPFTTGETKINIPVNDDHTFLINFFGAPNSYQTISFADVIDDAFGGIDLKDKIVLVGATPIDMRDVDFVPTSFGVRMPGVEIHANALQTILTHTFLTPQSKSSALLLTLLIAIIGMYTFNRLKISWSIITLMIGSFIYVGIASELFDTGFVLDNLHPLLAFFLTFIAAYIYRYVTADKEKRQIKEAFTHYLAGPMVDKLLKNPELLKLGGEKRELTIFFSDIADFTTISEKLDPEHLVTLLNDYLGAMTDIVIESGGTLDKYIGDAVMAFWGAPLELPNNAVVACKAALAQKQALDRLIAENKVPEGIRLFARMGLNTGDAVVGNMGSSRRFNYTVMGDAVNLASRLEGVNKEYNTQIIISESTYERAAKEIEARELDRIRVKGKKNGVAIYELISSKGAITTQKKNGYAAFAAGLAAYRAQTWDAAEQHFTEALAELPEDGPSRTMLERIKYYRAHPPAPDWDGVHTMKTK